MVPVEKERRERKGGKKKKKEKYVLGEDEKDNILNCNHIDR